MLPTPGSVGRGVERRANLIRLGMGALLLAAGTALSTVQAEESEVAGKLKAAVARSFRGQLLEVKLVEGSMPTEGKAGGATSSDEVDLTEMARWSLQYLRNNADPKEHFRPYFYINLLPEKGVALRAGPEEPISHYPWDLGDVDLRMLRAMMLAREMTGESEADDVEHGRMEYALSCIKDHVMWSRGDLAGRPAEQLFHNTWATARMIGLCAQKLKENGSAQWKERGEDLVSGLTRDCVFKEGAAWYKGILTDDKGQVILPNPMGPSGWSEWLSEFDQAAGSEGARNLAAALAYGLVTSAEPIAPPQEFKPDGSYQGHVHFHVDSALGALVAGVQQGNAKYVEWAKRVYDYTQSIGTDTGWFPEWQTPDIHCDHGETCDTGGMAGMAAWLGRAGYHECYDDLERMVRNYLRWVQFFVTPEYEALLRERNGDKAEGLLVQMRRLQGGFIASPEVNDLYNSAPPCGGCAGHQGIDMMGCCPPEGVRALWEAWANTVVKRGGQIRVNMSFNRETPEVEVKSFGPWSGQLKVVMKQDVEEVLIRPPAWAPREMVQAFRDGKSGAVSWREDYVVFEKVKKKQEVVIAYPLVAFKEKVTVAKGFAGHEKVYVTSWVGNTIVDIEPRGTKLGIFTGTPPHLPKAPQ